MCPWCSHKPYEGPTIVWRFIDFTELADLGPVNHQLQRLFQIHGMMLAMFEEGLMREEVKKSDRKAVRT